MSIDAPKKLRDLLEIITSNYLNAQKKRFTNNSLAVLIRKKSPEIIREIISFEGMIVKGSAGMGNWTSSPWIAVINNKETDGAQEGVYVVYLFSEDMENVYLTLNQGVSRIIDKNGRKKAHEILQYQAKNVRLNHIITEFNADDNIKISNKYPGSDYEKSTIFYKKYISNQLPVNEKLEADLKYLVNFYNDILNETEVLTANVIFSFPYTKNVLEGKRQLKQHFIRERNKSIIKNAKELGLKEKGELRCEICDFSFFENYGEIGKDFIEAHHTKPISSMRSGEVTNVEDISLLCSNCHSILHRRMPWLELDELKNMIQFKKVSKYELVKNK